MATKSPYVLRISDETAARIRNVAEAKDMPFASTCRLLMIERLDEIEKASSVPSATKPEHRGEHPELIQLECP